MASDDSLLPWDDQEILDFAEKLCVLKLFIFFMAFACKHKQKPNQKSSLGPGSAVGKRQKNGMREGERVASLETVMPLTVCHSIAML